MSKKEILEALGINFEGEMKSDSTKKISAKEFLEAALDCSFGDREPEIEKVVKVEITPKSLEEFQKDLCEVFSTTYGESNESGDAPDGQECQCSSEQSECRCSRSEKQQKCQCSDESQKSKEPLAEEEPLAQSTVKEPLAEEEPFEEEEVSVESSFASKLVSLLVDELYDLMNDRENLLIKYEKVLEESVTLGTTVKDLKEQNLALMEENAELRQEKDTLTSEIEGLTDTYKNLSKFITKFLEGYN